LPDLDHLDTLGPDWDARGKRATAILRETAIEEAAGKTLPLEGVEQVLRDLAGTANGMLQGIPDRCRALGCGDDMVQAIQEVVADVQLQISVALDTAAESAVQVVEEYEAGLLADVADAPAEVRGPAERRASRVHKGKPHAGNMKPKKVR
jgi:hypothetical protein